MFFSKMRKAWDHRAHPFADSRLQRRKAQQRQAKTRLYLEKLEDRVVPTIVFYPDFGTEPTSYGGGPVLNDAPVYLLFWGSYWNTSQGSTSQTQLTNAITNELNSPLYGNLKQYKDNNSNTAGPAYVNGSWTATETADPSNGFSDSQLQNVVQAAVNDPNSHIPSPSAIEATDGGHAPIYIVITPPGIDSYRGSNTWGYHNYFNSNNQNFVYGWVGNFTGIAPSGYGPTLNEQDVVTTTASHEIGESLTDPLIPNGYEAESGVNWSLFRTWDEIGDFEAEAYNYRLNGSLVQSLWDSNAQAFTISDGNSQNFYINPQWIVDYFGLPLSYNGNKLTVEGDQLGANYNDTITINTANNGGGLTVTLNGQTATFDPGQITSLEVNTGGGTNTVNILGLPMNMPTLIVDQGVDTVTVGNSSASLGSNGSMSGIHSNVTVEGPGSITLNIDDSGDSSAQTVEVNTGAISYPNTIVYYTPTNTSSGGVVSLNIYGGSGGNTFNVEGTNNLYNNYSLNTGAGNDTVNVYSTTGQISINNPGGQDTVNVGLGSMSSINGNISAFGNGSTSLYVSDSNDTTARTATMNDGSVSGLGAGTGTIYWTPTSSATGGVIYVEVDGGSGGNTFNVNNTSNLYQKTYLNTGAGNDTVNIYATTGGLDDYNPGGTDSTWVGLGSMANINGWVNAFGPGATKLYLIDVNDTTARTVTMTNGSVSGLGGGSGVIEWTPTSSATGGVIYLEVDSGSGGNTFNIQDTSSFYLETLLDPGTGTDTVNIYGTTGGLDIYNPGTDSTWVGLGSMANINGWVNAYGPGSTKLYLDDLNDTIARTVTMTNGSLSGLGAGTGTIEWTPSSTATGGVVYLEVDSGSGGNTFNVENTSAFYYWTLLDPGTGANTVNIDGTTGGLDLYNPGTDSTNVGEGSMANINGWVNAYGPGSTSLYLNDSSDSTARTVTMNDGSLSGLGAGAGTIYWTPSSTATGGVTFLSVVGGSGSSTFNINNTSRFFYYTSLATGAGNDTVNVYQTSGGLSDDNLGGSDTTNVGLGSVAHINGFVDVYGAGSTALVVDDHLDTTLRTVTLTSSQLTGLGNAGTLSYGSGVTALTVDGSSKASTYNIQSTAAGSTVTVNGGIGNDTFTLGSSNSLGGIQGAVTVNGGGGSNTLNANDSASASGQSYTLSKTTLTRSGIAAINYASLSAINVTASGNDTLAVSSTPGVPSITTTFNGGTGTNTLIGPTVSNNWTISGVNAGKLGSVAFSNFQNLVGGNLSNTFSFTSTTASVATINGGSGSSSKTLSYSSLPATFAVTVNLATNSAPLITSGFSNINAVTGSNDTANTLIGPNSTNQWTITGVNAGKVNSFSFSHVPNLVGGTGVDDFKFTGIAATVLSINGGGAPTNQGDWLDYSSLSTSSTVTVNLATGSAANVNSGAAGAVTGIQNVIGSSSGTNVLTGDSQGNILIGGSGANTLTGGSGNSLLIGGSGHGSITGGTGQDILIAGTTTYSATTTAGQTSLMAILAELQSADSFAQKVYDLIHGTDSGDPNGHGSDLNGTNKLTWGGGSPTVKPSTGAFTLSGDTSAETTADWFFSSASSTVNDFNDDGVQDEHNNNALGVL